MTRSETVLMMTITLLGGVFIGYILLPVLFPVGLEPQQFWLFVTIGSLCLVLFSCCMISNVKRGAVTKR